MTTEKVRVHLANLIAGLRDTGLSLLDQMEAGGEIDHEDRRLFQFIFCAGMGDAHFIMEKPEDALASNRSISKDRQVTSTIESGIRTAAEDLLEYIFGPHWRVSIQDVGSPLSLTPSVELRDRVTKLRSAVTVKPSEVRKLLDDPVSTRGATTGRVCCDGPPCSRRGGMH